MSETINRAVEALKRLPVRDLQNPGSELNELRLRETVRAVLAAIREPTAAMTEAGAMELPDYDPGVDDSKRCWQNMIDAALK